jgi:hypothetical protein
VRSVAPLYGSGNGLPVPSYPLGSPCGVCTVGEAMGPNEDARWFVLDRIAIEGTLEIR